jgi:hypothetical protein
MRNLFIRRVRPALTGKPLIALFGLAVLAITGCSSPSSGDGEVINEIPLPTDTLLNLQCPDVGVFPETCVVNDPENPYRYATITEFNVNDPEPATNKFELASAIPDGPNGAKARFYLWATALARFASGENQWFTARALHELWTAAEDPIIQEQALKAYRSQLDNFFGSVVFFSSLDFRPPPEAIFSNLLNELTAADVTCAPAGFKKLIPLAEEDLIFALEVLSEWGYTYRFDIGTNCENGVVSVNEFP